jgi:hypothetical protein
MSLFTSMNRLDREKPLEGNTVELARSPDNEIAILIAEDRLQFICQKPITLTYPEQD